MERFHWLEVTYHQSWQKDPSLYLRSLWDEELKISQLCEKLFRAALQQSYSIGLFTSWNYHLGPIRAGTLESWSSRKKRPANFLVWPGQPWIWRLQGWHFCESKHVWVWTGVSECAGEQVCVGGGEEQVGRWVGTCNHIIYVGSWRMKEHMYEEGVGSEVYF